MVRVCAAHRRLGYYLRFVEMNCAEYIVQHWYAMWYILVQMCTIQHFTCGFGTDGTYGTDGTDVHIQHFTCHEDVVHPAQHAHHDIHTFNVYFTK